MDQPGPEEDLSMLQEHSQPEIRGRPCRPTNMTKTAEVKLKATWQSVGVPRSASTKRTSVGAGRPIGSLCFQCACAAWPMKRLGVARLGRQSLQNTKANTCERCHFRSLPNTKTKSLQNTEHPERGKGCKTWPVKRSLPNAGVPAQDHFRTHDKHTR